MRTDRLNARYDTLYASSPGPVRGWGPPGQITAGKMLLTADTESGDAEVIFTDQVKLIYTPAKPEE